MCIVWETLLEMDRLTYDTGEGDQGAVALVLGPGESLRAGQSSSGLGLGDAFQLSQADIAGVMRILRAPAACSV